MRNYPLTVMTKSWNPQFPGPVAQFARAAYRKVKIPEMINESVINSPKLRALLDTVREREQQVRHFAYPYNIIYISPQLCSDPADLERSMETIMEILVEIGIGRSLPIIRGFGLLIEYMVRKVHMSLYINRAQVDRIKADRARNPVIYLPTHRSYADFILLSYLCFYLDIEVPTVAAGMGTL